MKLKALGALAKRTKRVDLIDHTNEDGEITRQFIHTRGAAYPLDGLPLLNENTVLTLLDVPTDERDFWTVTRMVDTSLREALEDNAPEDELEERMGFTLSAGGLEVLPVESEGGMMALGVETLAPIRDTERQNQYYRRELENGGAVTVVKCGLKSVATLWPCVGWVDEYTRDKLTKTALYAGQLWDKKQAEESNE